MDNCIFCDSPVNNLEAECSCGFNSKEEDFNKNILQGYYNKFKSENFLERRKFLYKVHNYFKEKGGWTQKKLAELCGVSPGHISTELDLAKDIEAGHVFDDLKEQHLQNRIYNQWQNIFNEWELIDQKNQGKYNTNEVGEIDFLAEHRTEKGRYLVIELKTGKFPDSTVGQILRYMGWVKNNLAKENGNVEGIIISNEISDEEKKICYALIHTINIELKYLNIEDNRLEVLNHDEANYQKTLTNLKKLSPGQLEEFKKKLTNYHNL